MQNLKVKFFLIVLLLVLLSNPTAVFADEAKSSWGNVVTLMNVVVGMKPEYWVESESWEKSLFLLLNTIQAIGNLDQDDKDIHWRDILKFHEVCNVILQKKLEISIDWLIEELNKLEGKTLVRKSDGYVRTITASIIVFAKSELKSIKNRDRRVADFDEYVKKMTNYDNNIDKDFFTISELVLTLARLRDSLDAWIEYRKNNTARFEQIEVLTKKIIKMREQEKK